MAIRPNLAFRILILLLLCPTAGPAFAASSAVSIGVDDYHAPGGQETKAALVVGAVTFAGGDVVAGGMRFDDTVVGYGSGLVLGGGVGWGSHVSLRALGSRFLGDEGFRGWRVKVGPQFSLPRESRLEVLYLHESNSLVEQARAVTAELAVTPVTRWTFKITGSFGEVEDESNYAGALGAAWRPVAHLELAGELGLARNPLGTVGPNARGPLGAVDPLLPGVGPSRGGGAADEFASTSSVGLRITFP